MQKKSKRNMYLEPEETLLEFFLRNTQTDKSEENMIQLISHLNSFIFSKIESKYREILEFGDYFFANGLEMYTSKAREEAFGEIDAFILNTYYKISEKDEAKRILEEIKDISFEERYEAMTLTDEIFNIKENKVVTLSTLDGPIEFTYNQESKKHYEILRQEFFNYIAYYAIKLGGTAGIVVRIKKKQRDELFGVEIAGGTWRPLKVYEFMEAAEGLDLTVRYTEISRSYE